MSLLYDIGGLNVNYKLICLGESTAQHELEFEDHVKPRMRLLIQCSCVSFSRSACRADRTGRAGSPARRPGSQAPEQPEIGAFEAWHGTDP